MAGVVGTHLFAQVGFIVNDIEETKKKWPAAEARFFAIEIRSMLALGQFDEAEKKIAALPDRKSSKYWAARLEVPVLFLLGK